VSEAIPVVLMGLEIQANIGKMTLKIQGGDGRKIRRLVKNL
jgi:hypothetical protein